VDPAVALQTLNHVLFTALGTEEEKQTGVAIICICIYDLGQLYFQLHFLLSLIFRTFQRPFVRAASQNSCLCVLPWLLPDTVGRGSDESFGKKEICSRVFVKCFILLLEDS
jgi:hypothetical protein